MREKESWVQVQTKQKILNLEHGDEEFVHQTLIKRGQEVKESRNQEKRVVELKEE